jgi:hypothetical protein
MTTPRVAGPRPRLSWEPEAAPPLTPPRTQRSAVQSAAPAANDDVEPAPKRVLSTLNRSAAANGPTLAEPKAGGVPARVMGFVPTPTRSPAPAEPVAPAPAAEPVSGSTAISPIPEGYRVPEDAEKRGPTLGGRILSGIGLVLFAPFYLLFAAIAFIPALVAGIVEGPKRDEPDGEGTFFAGFTKMFRRIMGWFPFVEKPFESLLQKTFNAGGRFWVDRTTDPNNVIITRRIVLEGSESDIAKVKALEPYIEAHLAIPGYRVNVEFVAPGTPDAATVKIDPSTWSNSGAWNPYSDDNAINAGDAPMMAHEILHILGLPDEYDYKTHFTNEKMGFWQRLGTFFMSLVQPDRPADADAGIMDNHFNKPLPRHYQAILAQ